MGIFKLHYLPVIVCVWFLGGFVLTYTIAVLGGHVYPFFPYISDTGVFAPERCIFGILMSVGSVLLAILMYLRYLQIKLYLDLGHMKLHPKWNNVSIVVGFLSCSGITILGNFNEIDSLLIHLIGATCTVTFGVVYFIIQTRISYESVELRKRLPPHGISKRLLHVRLFLIGAVLILQPIVPVGTYMAFQQFTGTTITWWTQNEGGFAFRLMATFSEWLLFICMFVTVATAKDEFKLIEFKKVVCELKNVPEKKRVK